MSHLKPIHISKGAIMALKEFNDSTFSKEVLESSLPVLVDFYATWCGPCKALGPILEEIARDLDGKITIGKVNIDDSPNTATQYGITSVPSIMFVKDGQVVSQHTGLLSKKQALDKINKILGVS